MEGSRRRRRRRFSNFFFLLGIILVVGFWWIARDLTAGDLGGFQADTNVQADLSREPLIAGEWSMPLPNIDTRRLSSPHHDYPAWDYGVAVGTPVFAMTTGRVVVAVADDQKRCGGTVTLITEPDEARISYCHLSSVLIREGVDVGPGDLLGLTGGEPGTPGAGNTRGPHLHLQIRRGRQLLCPQPLLLSINDGSPIGIDDLPGDGCISYGLINIYGE